MAEFRKSNRKVVLAIFALVVLVPALAFYSYKRKNCNQLFAELRPVQLTNCDMSRFGPEHDGGYLLCENLAADVEVAYSYGVGGRDGWGCDVSRKYGVPVHQYDCFNLDRPTCEGGTFIFHEECVGPETADFEGRRFDNMVNQIKRNGDEGKKILLKMDIEGAEWDILLAAPDEQLQLINQISIEFHWLASQKFVQVLKKLNRNFHVADLHMNNSSCRPFMAKFPSYAYEVLFVNKQVADADLSAPPPYANDLHRKNSARREDCQYDG